MKTFQGTHNSCIVYTDDIEYAAIDQIKSFLNSPAFEGQTIRVMPDVHYGKGAVIGFTSTFSNRLIPNTIGVDIGCGVLGVRFEKDLKTSNDFEKFDNRLRDRIPVGFSIHENPIYGKFVDISSDFMHDLGDLCRKINTDTRRVLCSLGTLGSGNHYIEIDKDKTTNELWLVVHSGSRNFGLQVANYHQRAAKAYHHGVSLHNLEYLEGDGMLEYLKDMRIAQKYAEYNREILIKSLLDAYSLDGKYESVLSVHNYIGDDRIIRKGAVSARLDEPVIIPWNMRDGVVIGRGKGNPDWNFSAPHGAGRRMGRKEARSKIDLQHFTKIMHDAGVWSSCISKDTLDEAPMAYKDAYSVEVLLHPTVEITRHLRPVYNFKAGGKE